MSAQLHPHWRIQYIRSRKEPGAGSPFAALLAAPLVARMRVDTTLDEPSSIAPDAA